MCGDGGCADDLCCQECGVLLSKATATFDELVEVLARKCRVNHHPQASVVHLAVRYALEESRAIDPSKLFKMLYTDARLICTHPTCTRGTQTVEGKASEARNVLPQIISE